MKKLFKPASLAFCLLTLVVFFFVGIYVAGIVGAGKNQMLAGGAIVFGWGVLFAVVAFFASFLIVYNTPHRLIVRLNWVLLVLLALLYGITHYRYVQRQKEREKDKPGTEQPKEQTTKPISGEPIAMNFRKGTAKELIDIKYKAIQSSESKMGIGMFSPGFLEHPTLYFYASIHGKQGIVDHGIMDSIVFVRDQHNNPTTSYAPPWLYPEHLKLDYGITLFKVLGLTQDFVKVEANKQTKQVTYLDKDKGVFMAWPEFLLSVNSVEFNPNTAQKVFEKPMAHAGLINVSFDFMQPLLIEEEWMYVRLVNEHYTEQGKGWIRWKKDNLLLIRYSLLS